jgi:hypothetical protein
MERDFFESSESLGRVSIGQQNSKRVEKIGSFGSHQSEHVSVGRRRISKAFEGE